MRQFAVINAFKGQAINLPVRKTKFSAGYDIELGEDVYIMPGEVILAKTGLKAYMEDDEYLALFIRSSIALKNKLMLCNSTGIVDADYVDNPDNEGHIQLMLYNAGKVSVALNKGTRIAQGIFTKYFVTDTDECYEERKGGFGSTDSKYPINKNRKTKE